MRLALYQPDIPQNTGTILRLAACLNVAVDIIGPAGFDMSDKALRRSGLDYLDRVDLLRHLSWADFKQSIGKDAEADGGELGRPNFAKTSIEAAQPAISTRETSIPTSIPTSADSNMLSTDKTKRLVLLTTKAQTSYLDFAYSRDDILLLGRESAGVPTHVHDLADARVTIPLQPGLRSLNIAISCAIVLGEALRQTDGFQFAGVSQQTSGVSQQT